MFSKDRDYQIAAWALIASAVISIYLIVTLVIPTMIDMAYLVLFAAQTTPLLVGFAFWSVVAAIVFYVLYNRDA